MRSTGILQRHTVVRKRRSGRARECARETRSESTKGKGEKEREELIQMLKQLRAAGELDEGGQTEGARAHTSQERDAAERERVVGLRERDS